MTNEDWLAAPERGVIEHLAEPRFSCRYAADAAAAGEFAGLTADAGGWFFCDFRWRDGLPAEPRLRALCAEAADFLDAYKRRVESE